MKWSALEPDNTVPFIDLINQFFQLTETKTETINLKKFRSPVCGVQGCSSLHQLLNNAWRVRGSPGASHVKSCVAIVVGNVYISSMLDQHSNSGKVGICCCSMQCSSTKCGSCVGGFTTLQSGDEFILKVKT